jgi:hypothetical protein
MKTINKNLFWPSVLGLAILVSCNTTPRFTSKSSFDKSSFMWIEEGVSTSEFLLERLPTPSYIWGIEGGGVVIFFIDRESKINAEAISLEDPYYASSNRPKCKQATVYLDTLGVIQTWEYFGPEGHRPRTTDPYENVAQSNEVFVPSFDD